VDRWEGSACLDSKARKGLDPTTWTHPARCPAHPPGMTDMGTRHPLTWLRDLVFVVWFDTGLSSSHWECRLRPFNDPVGLTRQHRSTPKNSSGGEGPRHLCEFATHFWALLVNASGSLKRSVVLGGSLKRAVV